MLLLIRSWFIILYQIDIYHRLYSRFVHFETRTSYSSLNFQFEYFLKIHINELPNRHISSTASCIVLSWMIKAYNITENRILPEHMITLNAWRKPSNVELSVKGGTKTMFSFLLCTYHCFFMHLFRYFFPNLSLILIFVIRLKMQDLSYKEKHWHEACFLCNKCRVSLVDKQFGSKAEKIYCGNCYDSQFASRCDGCGEVFRAGTYPINNWRKKNIL